MSFAAFIGERLQAFIYGVASVLLYPVLALELLALLYITFESGRFTLELLGRFRALRRGALPVVTGSAADSGAVRWSPVLAAAHQSLGTATPTHVRMMKALADADLEAARRLERTRMLVRLGPILGLMGTLIPISPALVGLAKGDVETLSSNLVIAFSTTVVGLLIGAMAYVVTTVRERHYRADVSELEYAYDLVEGAR